MKNIKIVIGANFGDEGKGLMTDYFCHQFSKDDEVLNVRFNGGAQAGHTVITANDKRHVFSHIGAGSFNPNVITYLSPDFIVNPILLKKEMNTFYKEFGVKPTILIDSRCRITIPQDMMLNQIVERSRSNKHGSCGVGINETIKRCNNRKYSLDSFDLDLIGKDKELIQIAARKFIKKIRAEYLVDRLKELNVSSISVDEMRLLYDDDIVDRYLEDLEEILFLCYVVETKDILKYDNIVFEGAQGLLLSEDNRSYFPHLTPSATGSKYIINLLKELKISECDLEVCYVSRSYFTRHGAGRFETECPKNYINQDIIDTTNFENEFQGNFRYGFFDKDLFIFETSKDYHAIKLEFDGFAKLKKSFAITHLDETNNRIALSLLNRIMVKELFDETDFTNCYCANGPKYTNVLRI